jgi:ribose 5-phosphate isomerase B
MHIAVAADHAGFPLKDRVIALIRTLGHEPIDLGTCSIEPTDYPDQARDVARTILEGHAERGVLLCGSGAGVSVAANKFRGIRAATCHDSFSAHQAVEDDNINILCIGSRVVGPELAVELVRTYLNARFSGAERHVRRLAKVKHFEEEFGRPIK